MRIAINKYLLVLPLFIIFWGCSDEQRLTAKLNSAGSLDGPYSLPTIRVTDVSGGGSGFGFGAVSSFPGATADLGGIGIPSHIEGYWAKKGAPEAKVHARFFHIASPVDSELARQKIETLDAYYENFKSPYSLMQFVVDGERAMLLYSLGCYSKVADCTPKINADPNGWVVKDPKGGADVVVLFDGLGEASATAFPKSPFDTRRLDWEMVQHGEVSSYEVVDLDGSTADDNVELPAQVTANWQETINPEDDWEDWKYNYYALQHKIENPAQLESNIQAFRREAYDGYPKGSRVRIILNGPNIGIFYTEFCWLPDGVCTISEDPEKRWEYIPEIEDYGVVLYRGKAQQSDTPFDGNK
ncbi:hypothetical protein [Grimontia sp. AD028]|uniref:hypothetical protein n=1 Tax=Grimontia sp. AD028 TaxID=1581149 RepID=UPI000A781393|nr:hypothetical protein [Grimontia sp. AD028]